MAMARLSFQPGVDVESSATASRGGWNLSDRIRFRSGFAEAIRGWQRICQLALQGICRAMHYFVDLSGNRWIALGTNSNLYLEKGGDLWDITPLTFVPGSVSSGANPYSLLIWSLDNFGEDLLAVPSGQGVFSWIPTDPNVRAAVVPTAPPQNQGGFMVMPAQIFMAFGSSLDGGSLDPLLVRWCNQSDFSDWTPSTTNQAGSYRLSRGNRIIGGLQIPGTTVLFTDIDLWTVQYIGFPLVFSFYQAGSNCGLISQKACAVIGSTVYWMSDHGFFRLSGQGPEQIPCSVWDIVFLHLDDANQDKCIAGTDVHYSEVWFFFPSTDSGTGEIDSYVKINILENLWDYGPATIGAPNAMARTAWTDQNQPGDPLSVDLNRLIQQMEVGYVIDGSTDPAGGSITSGYADISDGGQFMIIDQFIPDFQWEGTNPSLEVSFFVRNYPGEDATEIGPFTITPDTEYVSLRQPKAITIGTETITAWVAPRGREIAIEINTISGWWRFGAPRIRVAPAGSI